MLSSAWSSLVWTSWNCLTPPTHSRHLPKPLFCTSSRVLTIPRSQTASSVLSLVPGLIPMDVCSLQSCPDLLAKGLSAAACAGGNASCGYQWDWSRFRCHVLSMTDGRASFSAPKVGLGRRPQHSNTWSPGCCQPAIKEITSFSAPGKALPCLPHAMQGIYRLTCVFYGLEKQSRRAG